MRIRDGMKLAWMKTCKPLGVEEPSEGISVRQPALLLFLYWEEDNEKQSLGWGLWQLRQMGQKRIRQGYTTA